MMDPNETLRRLRAACQRERDLMAKSDEDEYVDTGDLIEVANEVTELAEALDEWLTKGGFAPTEWARDHVTVRGVKVTAYNSVVDPGTVSVQVETDDTEAGQRVRIMLNDADLYAGDPEVDA